MSGTTEDGKENRKAEHLELKDEKARFQRVKTHTKPHHIKPLQDLSLADSFMFGEVMRDERLCKLFLEALFQREVAKIKFITKEKDISSTYNSHGIRLDIFFVDNQDTRYCIEMQQAPQKELPRRIRYYQSNIDRDFLDRNTTYDKLPESYVIFICDYDPVGAGLACYEPTCYYKGIEDAPEYKYDDGSHIYMLNARYDKDNPKNANITADIAEYLHYIAVKDDTEPLTTALGKLAQERVIEVKEDNEKGNAYMTLDMLMQDKLIEGREEGQKIGLMQGIEKGRKEGKEEGQRLGLARGRREGKKEEKDSIIRQLAKKFSPTQIADMLDISQESVRRALSTH